MVEVTEERFDEMVNDALDKIPDQFVAKMRNLVILVRDFNEDSPGILGLYEGVSLTERTHHHTGFLPDAIVIYRGALQNMCSPAEQLAHEVKVTVVHELGHYFGFSEEELHRLGWGQLAIAALPRKRNSPKAPRNTHTADPTRKKPPPRQQE